MATAEPHSEEPFFEEVLETAAEGILCYHENGIVFANSYLEEILGYTPDELLGQQFDQLIAKDDNGKQAVLQAETRAEEGTDQAPIEILLSHSDGSEIPVALSIETTAYEGTHFFTATIRDISDRREQDKRLEMECSKLSSLFENTSDPIVDIAYEDDKPIIQSVNTVFKEKFGYCTDDVVGCAVEDVLIPAVEKEQAIHDTIANQVRDGNTVEREVRRRTVSGVRDFLLRAIPVDTDDRPRAYGIYTDITDQKEQERRLKALNEASQSLMQAETRESIAEITVNTAEYALSHPLTAIWEYDAKTDRLVPLAATDAATQLDSEVEAPDQIAPIEAGTTEMKIFHSGEITVIEDYQEADKPAHPDNSLGTLLVVPLGNHGQLHVGSRTVDPFEPGVRDLIEVLARHSEAALDHKKYEQRLQALNEASRSLLVAESKDEIATCATDIVQQILDRSLTAVWTYDDEEMLRPMAASEQATSLAGDSGPLLSPIGTGTAEMESFLRDETRLIEEYQSVENRAHPEMSLDARFVVPIGNHGIMTVGATDAGDITTALEDLLAIVARSTESAFDRLDRERAVRRRSAAIDAAVDGVAILQEDGSYIYVNEAYADMHGFSDPDEIIDTTWSEVYDSNEVTRLDKDVLPIVRRHGQWRGEAIGEHSDGTNFPQELTVSDLGDGNLVCVVREITERKERERQLESLSRVARELMKADTHEEIARIGSDAVTRILGADIACIRLVDNDADRLEKVALTEEAQELLKSRVAYDLQTTPAGHAFRESETILTETAPEASPQGAARFENDGLHVPIGDHGVLTIIGRDDEDIDDRAVSLAETLSVTIRTAITRAERNRLLREHEQKLRQQRDQLETVNRINGLIQELGEQLATATTREELKETICERIASSELYQSAWIGDVQIPDSQVIPSVGAGIKDSYFQALDKMELSRLGNGTVKQALETCDVQVVHQYQTTPERETNNTEKIEATAAIPLNHGERIHGVLVVNSFHEDVFSDNAITGFESLGRMAGFAINAITNRDLLLSDSVVELEFTVVDPSVYYLQITDEFDCRCRFERSFPTEENRVINYISITGTEPEPVLEVAKESDQIETAEVISKRDGGFLLQTVTPHSSVQLALESGATLRSATAEDGQARLTVEAPQTTDIRKIIETFDSAYATVELEAKRELDRSTQATEQLRENVKDRLTDKQQSALESAYIAGYYDWPRAVTAEDLADSMDISSSTLHQHLRKAIRTTLAEVFEDGER